MATSLEFLKPWHSVLVSCMISWETSEMAVLRVSCEMPISLDNRRTIYVNLSIDENNRRNRTRLQSIREAMELFTALSFVSNKAFTEFFPENGTAHQSSIEHYTYYFPEWEIYMTETLSSHDIAVIQSPMTWGGLLGFPDDPRVYSQEFRVAMQKLQAMGLEEATNDFVRRRFSIRWEGEFQSTNVCGRKDLEREDLSNWYLTILRELFNRTPPPAAQLCGLGDEVHASELWQQRSGSVTESECLSVYLSDMVMTVGSQLLTEALAESTIGSFSLSFGRRLADTPQITINAGRLLNTLLCSRSVSVRATGNHIALCGTNQMEFGELDLFYSLESNNLFIPICSAVAEVTEEAHLSGLYFYSVKERSIWSWLMYAFCCGESSISLPAVTLSLDFLTKANLIVMKAVLKSNYPRPISQQGVVQLPQYGYVTIKEGAHLQLCEFTTGDNTIHVDSCTCRFRALYNPAYGCDIVEVIVPGYGACKAKLGENVLFTPDNEDVIFQKKRLSGSLRLRFKTLECPELLMDLVGLVTNGLRSLELLAGEESVDRLDLTLLSAACPDLQYLYTRNFNMVVVSAHDESLQRWPIRTIELEFTSVVSGLSICLKDSRFRMVRELVMLEMTTRANQPLDTDEVRELKSYDGEFLPVTKQKLPVQLKAAMISVVSSLSEDLKAIQRLDAHILSLIFALAATPAQRSVKMVTI